MSSGCLLGTPYIGGKGRNALTYARLIPYSCDKLIEPFAGMASVSLNSPSELQCYLNDKSRGIYCLWKSIMSRPIDLMNTILKLEVTPEKFDAFVISQGLPQSKGDGTIESLHEFEGLYDEFQIAVMTFYLLCNSFDSNRVNMRYRNRPEKYEESKKRMIEAAYRITLISRKLNAMNTKLDNAGLDSFVWDMLDDPNACYIVDPPYEHSVMAEKKDLYLQAFNTSEQIDMLKMIKHASAKVVLCGYRGGDWLYDKYLNSFSDPNYKWHCYLINPKANRSSSSKPKRKAGQEFIWCNFTLPLNLAYSMNICPKDITREDLFKLCCTE